MSRKAQTQDGIHVEQVQWFQHNEFHQVRNLNGLLGLTFLQFVSLDCNIRQDWDCLCDCSILCVASCTSCMDLMWLCMNASWVLIQLPVSVVLPLRVSQLVLYARHTEAFPWATLQSEWKPDVRIGRLNHSLWRCRVDNHVVGK